MAGFNPAIYSFEEANGIQALVLELVEGPTLADAIDASTGFRAFRVVAVRDEQQGLPVGLEAVHVRANAVPCAQLHRARGAFRPIN
jgi:hypothetical protein